MRNTLIVIILLITPILSYSQRINKIRIEHTGNIDKPFTIIELYDTIYINNYKHRFPFTEIIINKKVYEKVIEYFKGNYIGKINNLNTKYGTFCITFFNENKESSKLFLNKEGAIFFLVNLHSLFLENEMERQIIYSIIKRLLW